MYDRGTGPPLIVIPGVQGRWEWLTPALRALGAHFRTISYTLSGDFGATEDYEPALGFDNYLRQLDSIFFTTGVQRAALCGVSYGGLIALRYATARPERVTALILVSSPAPGWVPTERQLAYVAHPWRSAPAFAVTAPLRLWPEIRAACVTWPERLKFVAAHGLRVLAAPLIPSVMAGRITLQQSLDFQSDCTRVAAPTLVITGEDELDQIVPTTVTRRYLSLIPGAQYEKMERSGHIGMLTRPGAFAETVAKFVDRSPEQTSA
jgi:3-oxoadipate enol-lactonase